ncbi:MAG: leucine-rich repeat domain-containing protein [Clostridiales bacterium]|nr:leucine-rich repeat domain-containing protein [Clostridiales bacterium]
MKRKVLRTLLLCLVLSLVGFAFIACGDKSDGNPCAAGHSYDADGVCTVCRYSPYTQGLEFELNDDGASYTVMGKGTATGQALVIPEKYHGLPVTAIAEMAFSIRPGNENDFERLDISDSVTHIGAYAFQGCHMLMSVRIGSGVTSIGERAFGGCSFLESITVDDNNATYHSTGNCVIETATKTLVAGCKASVIPSDGSVTTIGTRVFENDLGLTSIVIPQGVTSIGDHAFGSCFALESVTLGSSVTSIGESAFNGCKLRSIELPQSLLSIGSGAFSSCGGLTSVTIPQSVTTIGSGVFSGCDGLTVYCEASTKPSDWDTEWNNNNCPVIWDSKNNDKDEDGYAYAETDGLRYRFKDGEATVIKRSGISGEATVPASVLYKDESYAVKSIGERAFKLSTGLTGIKIGSSVVRIEKEAFYGCNNVKNIELPSSLSRIGDRAFYECRSLTSMVVPTSVGTIGTNVFYGCECLTLYCEAGSRPGSWYLKWHNDCPVVWDCENNDEDEDGYAYAIIGGLRYSFKDEMATVLRQVRGGEFGELTIPQTVSYKDKNYTVLSIADSAFYQQSSLKSITLPNSVMTIFANAFYGCTNLKSVTLSDRLEFIGIGAFENCSVLTSITIPQGVENLWTRMFYGCRSLKSVTIPSSVTRVDNSVFENCSALESITYEGTKAEWGTVTKGSG